MKTKMKILLGTVGLLVAMAPRVVHPRPTMPSLRLQVPNAGKARPSSPTAVPFEDFEACANKVEFMLSALSRCAHQKDRYAARSTVTGISAEIEAARPEFEVGLASVLRNLAQWGFSADIKERMDRVRYLGRMVLLVDDEHTRKGLDAMLDQAKAGWSLATPRIGSRTPRRAMQSSPRLAQVCALDALVTSPRRPGGPLRKDSQESFGTLSSSPTSVGSR